MERSELQIGEVTVSIDEAEEVLNAIRHGMVDAVVVAEGQGHQVYTFRDPSHPYRVLIEAMSEGAALVTTDGLICYHNPHFATLADDAGATLNGRMLSDLVFAEDADAVAHAIAAARTTTTHLEVRFRDPTERGVPVLLSLSPATLADIPVCCVVATDLSEHNRQEQQYRAARREIEARDRLVSIAAHELRGPIGVLVLQTEYLRLKAETGLSPDEAATAIHRLNVQCRNLSVMVGKLLDVGTIARGDLKLDLEACDLAAVIREVPLLGALDPAVRIDLDLAPAPGQWDRIRLTQVVTNLVSNAIKYGGGTPIQLHLRSDGRTARLVVQDGGPGIPVSQRERMFQPYERMATEAAVDGLGLGLYITSHIVGAHGGSVRIEDADGGGARFVIELPVRSAIADPA